MTGPMPGAMLEAMPGAMTEPIYYDAAIPYVIDRTVRESFAFVALKSDVFLRVYKNKETIHGLISLESLPRDIASLIGHPMLTPIESIYQMLRTTEYFCIPPALPRPTASDRKAVEEFLRGIVVAYGLYPARIVITEIEHLLWTQPPSAIGTLLIDCGITAIALEKLCMKDAIKILLDGANVRNSLPTNETIEELKKQLTLQARYWPERFQ
jgi:hypothetical protein